MKDPTSEDYIPPNRKLMLKCTHRTRWEKAEDDELRSFEQCEVMAKQPNLPMGSKALPLKWIYTIKRDLKGNIIRYKARLVAQGIFQVFGIDYTDTYSPVAKFVSIRILLAISVQLGLIIHTMDVDTAFLNATLEEVIWFRYLQVPIYLMVMMVFISCLSHYMDSSRHHVVGTILLMVTYWRMVIND